MTALTPRLAGAGHARAVRGPDAEDAPRPPLLAIPTSTVTQVNIWNKAQSHLDIKRLAREGVEGFFKIHLFVPWRHVPSHVNFMTFFRDLLVSKKYWHAVSNTMYKYRRL